MWITSAKANNINNVLSVELVKIALKDFEASKILFEKGLYPQAIFTFQQSLEKVIKAILLKLNLVRSKELVKRIGHLIIRNALELVMYRSIENFIILAGKVLELIEKIEKEVNQNRKIYIEDAYINIKEIIVTMMRSSSAVLSVFPKWRDELLEGMKTLGDLAFNKLDEEAKRKLDEAMGKITSLSIPSILPSEVIESVSRLISIIMNLISTLPEDKREKLMRLCEEHLDKSMLSLHLAYSLFIIMFWYIPFESIVSSVRYPIMKKGKRKGEVLLLSPLSIDKDTVIVKWCKDIIEYIDKTNILSCVKEFVEERIETPICKGILDALKKYFSPITSIP